MRTRKWKIEINEDGKKANTRTPRRKEQGESEELRRHKICSLFGNIWNIWHSAFYKNKHKNPNAGRIFPNLIHMWYVLYKKPHPHRTGDSVAKFLNFTRAGYSKKRSESRVLCVTHMPEKREISSSSLLLCFFGLCGVFVHKMEEKDWTQFPPKWKWNGRMKREIFQWIWINMTMFWIQTEWN